MAVSFVTSRPDLQRRAVELEDPGAELEDACEYLAELALAMLKPRGKSSKMRSLVKAGLAARISEWFGSDDGLLRILESAEAQTIAQIMGPDVEQEVCAYVAERRRLLASTQTKLITTEQITGHVHPSNLRRSTQRAPKSGV